MKRPEDFLTYAMLAAGALIATSCGLCTAAAGAWTLPAALSDVRADAVYAWMLLLPSLVIGGLATAFGAYLFSAGHRDLKAGRRVKYDRLDLVASGATLVAGALFGLVWLAITIRVAISGVTGLLAPREFDAGAGVLWLALAVAVCGGGAVLGARVALGGLRRLRRPREDQA